MATASTTSPHSARGSTVALALQLGILLLVATQAKGEADRRHALPFRVNPSLRARASVPRAAASRTQLCAPQARLLTVHARCAHCPANRGVQVHVQKTPLDRSRSVRYLYWETGLQIKASGKIVVLDQGGRLRRQRTVSGPPVLPSPSPSSTVLTSHAGSAVCKQGESLVAALPTKPSRGSLFSRFVKCSTSCACRSVDWRLRQYHWSAKACTSVKQPARHAPALSACPWACSAQPCPFTRLRSESSCRTGA